MDIKKFLFLFFSIFAFHIYSAEELSIDDGMETLDEYSSGGEELLDNSFAIRPITTRISLRKTGSMQAFQKVHVDLKDSERATWGEFLDQVSKTLGDIPLHRISLFRSGKPYQGFSNQMFKEVWGEQGASEVLIHLPQEHNINPALKKEAPAKTAYEETIFLRRPDLPYRQNRVAIPLKNGGNITWGDFVDEVSKALGNIPLDRIALIHGWSPAQGHRNQRFRDVWGDITGLSEAGGRVIVSRPGENNPTPVLIEDEEEDEKWWE
jgi:hypothetical protein